MYLEKHPILQFEHVQYSLNNVQRSLNKAKCHIGVRVGRTKNLGGGVELLVRRRRIGHWALSGFVVTR